MRCAPAHADDDLMLSPDWGVAWQIDRQHQIAYDAEYYVKCSAYEQAIANRVNAGRLSLVQRHVGAAKLVDVGIGDGAFLRRRPGTWGHDVNPVAQEWLKRNDLWTDTLAGFAGATFWDVIEHVDTPEAYLRQIGLHGYAFFSLPVFTDLTRIRDSRHYRPGEHLYYWTQTGFQWWMHRHGFLLLEHDTFEITAGRDSIHSWAFRRNRWPVEYDRKNKAPKS